MYYRILMAKYRDLYNNLSIFNVTEKKRILEISVTNIYGLLSCSSQVLLKFCISSFIFEIFNSFLFYLFLFHYYFFLQFIFLLFHLFLQVLLLIVHFLVFISCETNKLLLSLNNILFVANFSFNAFFQFSTSVFKFDIILFLSLFFVFNSYSNLIFSSFNIDTSFDNDLYFVSNKSYFIDFVLSQIFENLICLLLYLLVLISFLLNIFVEKI